MKRHRTTPGFIDQLKDSIKSLKDMKPGEMHVFSINARYGHYQIAIGPEHKSSDPYSNKGKRPIEISGEIHHLFVSPRAISIHPSRKQVMQNMRGTVIMRDLSIHLVDPDGKGEHLASKVSNTIHARECINLAGDKGNKLIEEADTDSHLKMAAYRIAQEDILKTLKEDNECNEEHSDTS